MEAPSTDLVKLLTADDQELEVSRASANMSVTLKSMIEDLGEDSITQGIIVPNVTEKVAKLAFAFCDLYRANPVPQPSTDEKRTDTLAPWAVQFLEVDQSTLFELILAANYLDIKPLLDATCMTVANMIKGKTPEEIRQKFSIKNDFTPEEEVQVRKENEWCEER